MLSASCAAAVGKGVFIVSPTRPDRGARLKGRVLRCDGRLAGHRAVAGEETIIEENKSLDFIGELRDFEMSGFGFFPVAA